MGFLDLLRGFNRRHWHICYECLRSTGNVAEDSIFFYAGPREPGIEGHAVARCPRCDTFNTRSFQFLKDKGEDSTVYGLERIVKTHPRSRFAVKPAAGARDSGARA